MQAIDLNSLGWTPELSGAFASLAAQGLIPGRVGARHRGHIAFGDIEALALQCRFRDCRHHCEPGGAVRTAVAEGLIAADRLGGYRKLRREFARLERKDDSRRDGGAAAPGQHQAGQRTPR